MAAFKTGKVSKLKRLWYKNQNEFLEDLNLNLMKELPKANPYEIALVFLGYRHKYVCEGNSMNPTLKNGDVVLVDKNAEFGVGDIVIAKHPVEQVSETIKRIKEINSRGHYFLVGDNLDDSNDSRNYGAVTKDYIKGKVVAKLS